MTSQIYMQIPGTASRSPVPQRYTPSSQPLSFKTKADVKSQNLVNSQAVKAWLERPALSSEEATRGTQTRNQTELALVNRLPVCPVVHPEASRKLSPVGLLYTLKEDYYDPDAMQEAICGMDG